MYSLPRVHRGVYCKAVHVLLCFAEQDLQLPGSILEYGHVLNADTQQQNAEETNAKSKRANDDCFLGLFQYFHEI